VATPGVHHVLHPPVELSAWPDADRRSRIVFITRGLERAEVEETWSALRERDGPSLDIDFGHYCLSPPLNVCG
jgi:Cobalamin synthesis protein cobW C-terminal domain